MKKQKIEEPGKIEPRCNCRKRKKRQRESRAVKDARMYAISFFGALLVVAAFLAQSKFWPFAVPIFILLCSKHTILVVCFASMKIRRYRGIIKLAVRWISTALALAISSGLAASVFTIYHSEEILGDNSQMMFLGICIFGIVYFSQIFGACLSKVWTMRTV